MILIFPSGTKLLKQKLNFKKKCRKDTIFIMIIIYN